jgi:hypothetical protein
MYAQQQVERIIRKRDNGGPTDPKYKCIYFAHLHNEFEHIHKCLSKLNTTGRCGFKPSQIDECGISRTAESAVFGMTKCIHLIYDRTNMDGSCVFHCSQGLTAKQECMTDLNSCVEYATFFYMKPENNSG